MTQQLNLPAKSFWQRKEGTTGMVVLSALACAGFLGLYTIMPLIVSLLASTVTAVALGTALVALLLVVTNRRVWTLSSYLFRSAMRGLTGLFVTIDPIGIMKNYVEDMRSDVGKMDEQIENLSGQRERLRAERERNARESDNALKVALEARNRGKEAQAQIQANQASRLQRANEALEDPLKRIDFLYDFLVRMRETTTMLVADMELEVKQQERQREMMTASVSAIRMAMRVINGDGNNRELFDQTMEYLADDYAKKAGEVRESMRMAAEVMDRADLERGVYDEQAMKLLDQLERKNSSLLTGPTQTTTLTLPPARTPVPIGVGVHN